MAIGSLGFIGAGAMCNAIVRGVLKAKLVYAQTLKACRFISTIVQGGEECACV